MRSISFGIGLALTFTSSAFAHSTNPVQRVADQYVSAGTVPGVVIAVGEGHAPPKIYAAGSISEKAGSPRADRDSLWRIYSMTKPITGIAAMLLIEQGKLKLDQPISDFIPAFREMKVLTDPTQSLAARPAKAQITVRHLLTHTAGFGYNIITTGPLLDEYNRLGINPAQVNTLLEFASSSTRPKSLAAFADAVASAPLLSDPGTKWGYSISIDVLGRVIEVASGKSFDQFVNTQIFAPLKMQDSYWTVPGAKAARLADNFAPLAGRRVVADPGAASVYLRSPTFPYGGAGLVMSARDYDRFLHMLLNEGALEGVRILKPETVRLAMSDLLPAGVERSALDMMSRESGARYGFGAGGSVFMTNAPGGPAKGSFGWGGAAGTIGWVDPVNKLRVTGMLNLFGETALRKEAAAAIYMDRVVQ